MIKNSMFKYMQLQESATVTFNITGPEGAVPDATIYIDGRNVGTTDASGNLTIDIPASSVGTPHEYLIHKENLNNSAGSILVFTGVSKTQNILMTKSTPGAGSVIIHVTCGGNDCPDVYIGVQGAIKGITDQTGTAIIEDLIPIIGSLVLAFKPGFFIGTTTMDIIENTTTESPIIDISPGRSDLGSIGFIVFNTAGFPVVDAQISLDSITLPFTNRSVFSFIDRIPLGQMYNYSVTKTVFDNIRGTLDLKESTVTLMVVVMHTRGTTSPGLGFGSVIFTPVDDQGNLIDLVNVTIDRKVGTNIIDSVSANIRTIFDNITEGVHTYTAKKEGYETKTDEFTIERQVLKNVTIPMTKL